MISALAQLPIAVNLTVFVLAASGVWFAGSRLAIYADAIADRKRIGQAFMGLVFVAAATSLPEMVTTLYGALAGEAELVLGNMFGGITMQTAILALADLSFAAVALTSYPRGPASALEATLLIALLALLIGLHAVGEFSLPFGVGLGTLFLGIAYVGIVFMLREYDKNDALGPRRGARDGGAVDRRRGAERTRPESLPIPRLGLRHAERRNPHLRVWD